MLCIHASGAPSDVGEDITVDEIIAETDPIDETDPIELRMHREKVRNILQVILPKKKREAMEAQYMHGMHAFHGGSIYAWYSYMACMRVMHAFHGGSIRHGAACREEEEVCGCEGSCDCGCYSLEGHAKGNGNYGAANDKLRVTVVANYGAAFDKLRVTVGDFANFYGAVVDKLKVTVVDFANFYVASVDKLVDFARL